MLPKLVKPTTASAVSCVTLNSPAGPHSLDTMKIILGELKVVGLYTAEQHVATPVALEADPESLIAITHPRPLSAFFPQSVPPKSFATVRSRGHAETYCNPARTQERCTQVSAFSYAN